MLDVWPTCSATCCWGSAVACHAVLCCCSGFTSVAQYLDSKLSSTAGEAKVSVVSVSIWVLMAAAMVVPLGGGDAYTDSLAILTDGGLEMGNLVFLWVALLTYFSAKVSACSRQPEAPSAGQQAACKLCMPGVTCQTGLYMALCLCISCAAPGS